MRSRTGWHRSQWRFTPLAALLLAGCSALSTAPDDEEAAPEYTPGLITELAWMAGSWTFRAGHCDAFGGDGWMNPSTLGHELGLELRAGGQADVHRGNEVERLAFETASGEVLALGSVGGSADKSFIRFVPPLRVATWSNERFWVDRHHGFDGTTTIDRLILRTPLCGLTFERG